MFHQPDARRTSSAVPTAANPTSPTDAAQQVRQDREGELRREIDQQQSRHIAARRHQPDSVSGRSGRADRRTTSSMISLPNHSAATGSTRADQPQRQARQHQARAGLPDHAQEGPDVAQGRQARPEGAGRLKAGRGFRVAHAASLLSGGIVAPEGQSSGGTDPPSIDRWRRRESRELWNVCLTSALPRRSCAVASGRAPGRPPSARQAGPMKTLCVLQHTEAEYLGLMEDHLRRAQHPLQLQAALRGRAAPCPTDAGGYDGLILLGRRALWRGQRPSAAQPGAGTAADAGASSTPGCRSSASVWAR